jgi:hypothetical protein
MLRARLTLTLLVLTLALQPLRAQTASSPVGQPWMDRLARPAGMIVSGTVIRVQRESEHTSVRVTFRVDDAVRGCATGDTVEILEWAGWWAHADRYRRGEKLLLFLYARNGEGLTSPVAGDLGVIRLNGRGALQLSSAQATLFGLTHPQPHSPSRPARPQIASPALTSPAPTSKDDVIVRLREVQ